MEEKLQYVEETFTPENENLPTFKPGDDITVYYKIIEGGKERTQPFQGTVLQIKGSGTGKSFTVRRVTEGVGVERIFPARSPKIHDIKVNKRGKVKRSKLNYLRKAIGKKARVEEQR